MTHSFRAGRPAMPRARGLIPSLMSAVPRALERLRRYSGLFELAGSFRAGRSKKESSPHFHVQPLRSDHKDYLHALERLTSGSGGKAS